MQMEEDLNCMARKSYGFGNWKAPCWFLGPEQGMSKDETELKRRVEAWRHFGSRDLDDCREFHYYIQEHRLHGKEEPGSQVTSPILQRTWAKLLLVLMAYFDPPRSAGDRLAYQVNEWGSLSGETCVIELSGIAAHSQRVKRDPTPFLQDRIQEIGDRMRYNKPEFILLYGKGRNRNCEEAWGKLTAGAEIIEEAPSSFAKIRKCDATLVAWTPHPVSFGPTSENWTELGAKLRHLAKS